MKLEDKIVLVTGGSAGLGEQICYEAAKKGAIVVVCARRIQKIGQVKEKCQSLSQKTAFAFQLDISDPASVERMYQRLKDEVGQVDILVNNAGIGYFSEFVDFDYQKIVDMFEVNILGMMFLTQKIAADMLKLQQGSIINIASAAGKMATPKSSVYSATKFAIIGFSNALRLELKPFGINVTTVNPGPVKTDFFLAADPSGDYLANVDFWALDPKKLAGKIVRSMEHSKREINQPQILGLAAKAYTLFPRVGDFLAGSIFNKK